MTFSNPDDSVSQHEENPKEPAVDLSANCNNVDAGNVKPDKNSKKR